MDRSAPRPLATSPGALPPPRPLAEIDGEEASSRCSPWQRRLSSGSDGGPPSPPHLVEIAQIRRLLVLARGHQVAVVAEKIVLPADHHMWVVLVADEIDPRHARLLAHVGFYHRPRAGERMIDGGDLVNDAVAGLVEIDALLDNGLIVLVQRQASAFIGAVALDVAGLDFQRVVFAVAVGV